MKLVFFGSDDFAAAHLKALNNSKHEVLACVTQPDRPKGRGMKVVVSPIKEYAQSQDIAVWQPATLKDASFIQGLKELRSDLWVVIAYGQFLPSEVLHIPPLGAINVHGSLLPKYRGAAPINWVIINGEKETGISIIRVNEQMDAGDILAQSKTAIEDGETAVTLRAKMITQGVDLLLKTMDRLEKCTPRAQDNRLVTFAPKLTKERGVIQWEKSACEIDRLIRGLLSWPSAYTFYNGKMLKILEAQVLNRSSSQEKPGTVLEISKQGITVATGSGDLLIKKVHLQDSKPMDAHSFIIGHVVEAGYRFE